MNRLLISVCFIFAIHNHGMAQRLTKHTQLATSDRPFHYLLYQPEPSESEGKAMWPLVLFLHGGGEGGDDLERVKKHGLPKRIAAGKSFPFIVVAPQNPSDTQFWDDQQLVRLLHEVETSYPVDPSRVYVTGLSRGAYGAWRLAIQNPDRFAALVPVSGGGPLPYASRLKQLPMWVFHGAKDEVIPIDESQRMVDALRKSGANVKFTIYPDAGHDAWTETYNNSELYEWMLRQRKPPRGRVASMAEPTLPPGNSQPSDVREAELAVLKRLNEIEQAARELQPDRIYEFVLENDKGSLLQDGQFFRTRQDALQSTKRGFQGLSKVSYHFDQQHVHFLSPTIALATGEGSSSAVTNDGRTVTARFCQTVVLVLSDGEWMVSHAHRSFPPR